MVGRATCGFRPILLPQPPMTSLLPDLSHVGRISECIGTLREVSSPVVMSVSEAIQGDRDAQSPGGLPLSGTGWRESLAAVVLPGSFNPLHTAHLHLLIEALRSVPRAAGSPPPVAALSLSVRTIDKAQPTGMALEDRAWTMYATLAATTLERCPVALLASHGLYLDQAIALRNAMPELNTDGLWFAIGHDKAVQIFDARYYDDRDTALEELFRLAGLLVTPRAGGTAADLLELMDLPGNRRFAGSVRPILFPSHLADVSSTAFRAGSLRTVALPAPVAAMIEARRCYG